MSRRLHIGGQLRVDGWEVFDAIAAPHVDHLGDARDLSRFADGAFAQIYASHVVEHFDYVRELEATLREWHRVLEPGGSLLVSVPDMDVLCRLFLDRRIPVQDRYEIMRMMFGGHTTSYDYHYVGLNQEFLASFLFSAGFPAARRVPELGVFDDTSSMRVDGMLISLNVIAYKAPVPEGVLGPPPGAPRKKQRR